MIKEKKKEADKVRRKVDPRFIISVTDWHHAKFTEKQIEQSKIQNKVLNQREYLEWVIEHKL